MNRAQIESLVAQYNYEKLDGILILLLTYSQGAYLVRALEENHLPLALALIQPEQTVRPDFIEWDYTVNQGIHGSQDQANVMTRMGVNCVYYAGNRCDGSFVRFVADFGRAAMTVRAMKRMRIGVIGRLKRKEILHMVIGLVYVYIGLTIFLMGVNVGFMPVGSFLGGSIASHTYNWILIPIAMVIGYFIVQAEPAVHVLNKQVEEITAGSIPAHAMNLALSVGVAISLGLAMIRVLTGISIMWFLVPGYVLSLALSFVVPQIFTSVAFDSGGVASGPMTATFLLPFALGACDAVGGNLVTDAFGVVAMVAMTPLVTIQLLGLSYQRKLRRAPAPAAPVAVEELIEPCCYFRLAMLISDKLFIR